MQIVKKGISLWVFLLGLLVMGSGVCWAQEDIITTESDQSIVVLEVQEGQKVQLVCKTEVGKKTWIFLNVPELAPGVTYIMPHLEYCQANNGFFFPLEEDTADMFFSESPSESRINLGAFDLTTLLPLAITTRIGESSYDTDVVQTIVLMPPGLSERGEEDNFLIDPEAMVDEESRNKTLATRTEGEKKAYIIHITSGMIMGIALRCYDSGKLVFAGFKNFSDAVRSGNNFVSFRELPGVLEAYPEDASEISEMETEDVLADFRGCTDIKKENIRISVCQANSALYYYLRVYINDNYRVTLYRPCNKCPRFTFDTGLSHARQLVNALQGWN